MNKQGLFGFSKVFIIILFLAAVVGWGTHNLYNFIVIMGIYIIIKVIWNLLS